MIALDPKDRFTADKYLIEWSHYFRLSLTAGKTKHSQNTLVLFLSRIVSTVRNTARSQSRVEACDTMLALSERISDEAKLDRVLPYLITLLSDEVPMVRAAALRTVAQLVVPSGRPISS